MTIKAGIVGIGKALPEKCVSNQDLVDSGLETSDEWIQTRTGIKTRYIADENTATSDLCVIAAQNALQQAGKLPSDIDLVLCATSTPDFPLFPSTACIIQNRLEIPVTAGAIDMAAACSGFNYALTTAIQYVENGSARNVLVIAGDVLSKFLNWQDRSTCILFGDGAGSAVVSPVEDGTGHEHHALYSNGAEANILKVSEGGSRTPISMASLTDNKQYITMNGRAVFKVAVNSVVPAIQESLEAENLKPDDVDLYVFHQANLRIIESAREKLGVDFSKMMVTVSKYGNTSAASIPIALTDAVLENRLKKGDRVALIGFGAGFTWAVNILKWSY